MFCDDQKSCARECERESDSAEARLDQFRSDAWCSVLLGIVTLVCIVKLVIIVLWKSLEVRPIYRWRWRNARPFVSTGEGNGVKMEQNVLGSGFSILLLRLSSSVYSSVALWSRLQVCSRTQNCGSYSESCGRSAGVSRALPAVSRRGQSDLRHPQTTSEAPGKMAVRGPGLTAHSHGVKARWLF